MKKYILQRKNSFIAASSGLILFFKTEAHAAIHLMASLAVLLLAWMLSVSGIEWTLLILTIGLVVAAEIFNTTVEKMADFIQPEKDPRIKFIKDIAAGAVLWSAIVAAVIGGIVFIPYIFPCLQ